MQPDYAAFQAYAVFTGPRIASNTTAAQRCLRARPAQSTTIPLRVTLRLIIMPMALCGPAHAAEDEADSLR